MLEHRWARILVPSLSDLFFLAILGWLFLSGSAGLQGLLADADIGWHIRTGEYILDHHVVPTHDLYSFSKPNAPWYAWEWLSDVAAGASFRWAGLKGVVLGAAVLIVVFATTLIRRMVWRGSHMFVAMAVALLGVGAASVHFLARPHVFTLLLLSISVWMIERDRRDPMRQIWLLVPITALWTNLHGGFLAIIATLGLAAAGVAIEDFLSKQGFHRALRYGYLTVACAAASLVNPYGWNLHKHVIEYLRSDWIKTVVQEFQSPSFRNENMLQFEVLLLVGVIVAGALIRQRRVVEALWILFWAHMSLTSVRHAPIFVTVTAPILASEISAWWTTATAGAGKASLVGIVNQMAADSLPAFRRSSLIPAAVVIALIFVNDPIRWPHDFPDLLFPTDMVHKHEDLLLGRRVLTTDQWGDYLIFLNPQQKVYADGRSDFYGPEIGNPYMRLLNGGWDWDQTLAKYQFDSALLPVEMAASQLLKRQPGWHVVEDNGKQILLVHTSPAGITEEK